MAKPLAPGFSFGEATLANSDEIWQMFEVANAEDDIWQAAFRGCNKEDIHPWLMAFTRRYNLPDITIYTITEKSIGRIVGWTALQFPWVDRPLKEEELAIVNSQDIPTPPVKGMNVEAFMTLIESLVFAGEHGYKPQTDYRKNLSLHSPHSLISNICTDRRGTMIHPDFQKRGFGTFLTHHCNAVADKTGGKTWITARPTSVKMFRQCGFKDVATHNANLERWSGNTEKEITWLLVRDARAPGEIYN